MANPGVTFTIDGDATGATRALKDAVREVDKLPRAVDKAERSVSQSTKGMAADFRRTGDAADDATSRMDDGFRQSEDSALGAATSIGEAFGSGSSPADALGSLGEVVESFAGSFGKLALPIGIAGGLIIGMFQAAAQKAEEAKRKVEDIFGVFVTNQGVLDEAFKTAQLQEFVNKNKELLQQVDQLLGPRGLKLLGDAVQGNDAAYAALNQELQVNINAMTAEQRGLQAIVQTGEALNPVQQKRLEYLNATIPVLQRTSDEININNGAVNGARESLRLYNGMLGQTAGAAGTATAAMLTLGGTAATAALQAQRAAQGRPPLSEAEARAIAKQYQARAGGGPVTAGVPYRVGEYGAEVFVPNQDGTIVPNGAAGAASVSITQHITTGDPMIVAARTAEALRRYAFRNAP